MLTFGLLMGAILLIAGLATYVFAPRVGPNPIFGVRVGYSSANREVWDKTNRFGGLLIALTGIGLALLAWLLYALGMQMDVGIGVLTTGMIIGLLIETAWTFVYARNLAQATALSRQLVPVRFQWTFVTPMLGAFGLLLVLAALTYPSLPAERMASHFDIAGRPDGWMGRDDFFLTFLGLALGLVILDLLVVFVATREPLIAFERWGTRWQLEPANGLIYQGLAIGLVIILLAVVLLDVVQFNLQGAHLFPMPALLGLILVLIGLLIALFFIFAKKEPEEKSV